jgi:hypothetical protein
MHKNHFAFYWFSGNYFRLMIFINKYVIELFACWI